jgi:hypothetical protein
MNQMITRNEIIALSDTWCAAREAALDKALTEAAAGFIGRRFEQRLVLGSKKALYNRAYTVEAEVVRAAIGREGVMILIGTYTHPITGRLTETELHVDEFPNLVEDGATTQE